MNEVDYNNPALRELAKRITLDAGLPWYDPVTGRKYSPPKKKTKKRKKGK